MISIYLLILREYLQQIFVQFLPNFDPIYNSIIIFKILFLKAFKYSDLEKYKS